MKLFILLLTAVPIFANDDVASLSHLFDHTNINHLRERRYAQSPAEKINYQPFAQAPAQIKQLLQLQQAREPLTHIPSQPPPQLASSRLAEPQYQSQAQVSQYKPQVQYGSAPQQPAYRSQPQTVPAQQQQIAPAQQYTPQYGTSQLAPNRQSGQPSQPYYKAVYQPVAQQPAAAAAPQPQYSNKLPAQLQQLLQVQSQLPNSIPPNASQSKVLRPNQQPFY